MTDDSLANIRNSDAGLTGEELLRIEDLSISFGDFEALHHISFSLPKGLLVGLIGPNGCGKSTMMKCISKLHTKWTGKISTFAIINSKGDKFPAFCWWKSRSLCQGKRY